ncbi:MAG: tetratricopeptide repeat protein [Acidobacteria bacterium]|nr:tetratricopeptide repeat protein [Acidobacteriota bacterium]
MRLGLAVAGLVALAVMAALAVQQLNRGEQFRTLMAAGDAALTGGNTYIAIEAYSGAIALRPDSMESHWRRGQAYQAQQHRDEAVRDYLEATRLQPGAADPLLALANLYDGLDDAAQAAEWFDRAAEVDRQNPALLYRLALARYRAGQAASAIEPLRNALALDAGFDEAYYLLGVVLRDTGDLAGATAALERAIQANPNLIVAREELADLYQTQGRLGDEMAQLSALATADAGGAREVAIALAEARQGRYDSALATLASAQSRFPGDFKLTLSTGRVHLMRAENAADEPRRRAAAQQALGPLEEALGGSARRSEGLTFYARALFFTGEVAEAERLLQEATATTPFERTAFAYLADAAEQLGHYMDARNWLARFDAIKGDTASAATRSARARRLGELSLAAGDPARALRYLERAVQDGLGDATLLGWLADARWKTGDKPGAREALATALARAPDDPALRRLAQAIK